MPPGWQILYFLPRFAPGGLRPDGSARDTGVIPPLPLPRRMFAGERLRFHRPIRIGDALRREIELTDMSVKAGSTGTLVFATTMPRIFTKDGLAIEEERHRIHYDRAWAMEVEGYPGLVVHGPLTSTLLLDFARDSNPGRRFAGYTTQARAPLFDTAPFELRGRPTADGTGCELWAVTPEGTIAMSAQAELA